MSEIVVIAGLSGAGRSTVANNLEDLGWYKIDNVPLALVPLVAELPSAAGGKYERMVIVLGTTGHDEVIPALAEVRNSGVRVRIVFLEAASSVLVRRYENTRRPHPYAMTKSVVDAIEDERRALEEVKAEADVVIDTTNLNVHQLRDRIVDLFANESPRVGMQTRVLSFGYKHGLPIDVDIVIDCRFLPNPHWVDELRPQTGLDDAVAAYVMGQAATAPFLDRLERLLSLVMPQFVQEGKSYLTIAFGCTGGHHRSVVIAEQVAAMLRRLGYDPTVAHRDIHN
ncbi:MAG: RNase adapter RapZ [Acidimicrobiales bacterium]